jgi:hypothetical protein
MCAISAIVVVAASVVAFTLKANRWINESAGALTIMGAIAVFELVQLVRFEQVRKQGEALAEVLSDEVQRAPDDTWQGPWEFRIAIRTFTNASDLPLFPGRYGPSVYASVTILLGVGSILYWTSHLP